MQQFTARQDVSTQHHRLELTLRGLLLGAAITVVFMAANIYMGLKTGMTFSSSIPAAVLSMAMLRMFKSSNILENNMVQTQASAAGTLCNVVLVLPGLVMIGHWHGFGFLQTTGICLTGGLLGVMFSIPLRRTMVVDSDLPFPEGVAAAEVLRAGHDEKGTEGGIRDLATGGIAAAVITLCASGLKLLGDGVSLFFTAGHAVFRIGTGFSLALIGVGYLVGIGPCLALLFGVVIAWGVAVPILTTMASGSGPGSAAALANQVWSDQVRLIGAGIIAIGGVWIVIVLMRPMIHSIASAISAARTARSGGKLDRQERDIPIGWVGLTTLLLTLPLGVLFAWFMAPGSHASLGLLVVMAAGATLFTVVFGFLMATACGYMAGLLGSSSSPISGIGILSTLVVSLLLSLFPHGSDGSRELMAVALLIATMVVTMSSIANDNLQDLKTGRVVDATPWRQEVALLIGVSVGALAIAPLLDMLYQAYGFGSSLPRPGMNPAAAMPAPQASLVTTIAKGIFEHKLPWAMVIIGIAIGALLIPFEMWLRRRSIQLPVLTVGIGIYLPPTVTVTIAFGGIIGWLAERQIRRRSAAGGAVGGDEEEVLRRRGVLLASGFLVGESLAGIALAAVEVVGRGTKLAVVGQGFAPTATILGMATFVAVAALFYRAVSKRRPVSAS